MGSVRFLIGRNRPTETEIGLVRGCLKIRTTTISNHNCLISSDKHQSKIELIPPVKSDSSTTNSDTTASDRTNSVNCKTLQKHKRLITSVISDWVCSNTRPINIVEDIGFDCGPVSASSILPCRERCLALSPDLWSDGYQKTSQSNKTGANVLKVLEEGLSLYDLVPVMSDIVWVCDGGSNLLKALAKFTVVRCIAHRLNNCLQTFFFKQRHRSSRNILFPDHFHDNSDDQDSNSDNEQNDNGFDDNDANDQHKTVPNIILQYREKN
ncbi:unnamed protein product [Rotaria magnacalcarata]|uniref:Uncharacterized protein n=1 Tax=Rotaria magnacalcarata TaxID=392030 RepID=A0A819UKP3_9BILA|nr:unnamed protein product [Rotaria magnacalcarata]